MLRSAIGHHVLSAPNSAVRSRRAPSAETEQRLKGRGRFPPAVMAKRELVQVHLELRSTDAMMGPDEPLLQIADRAVRQRHDRLGSPAELAAQRLRTRHMFEAGERQPVNCFRSSV